METKLVQIGNSRGVRITKRILDQCRIEGRLDLNPEFAVGIVARRSKPQRNAHRKNFVNI